MKIRSSRTASYIIIALIYVLASALGVFVYSFFSERVWLGLLIADISATVFVFIFSLVFKNASVYDPYWSVQPIVILLAFLIGKELTAAKILIVLAVFLWGVRLTLNWAYTFKGLMHQDWRYTMLCEKTGRFYPIINFVGIHLVPTLVVYAVTLPAVYVVESDAKFNAIGAIFVGISAIAFLLQGTADYQMHKFRRTAAGGFIRNGLWKYSRHPNYLGEILMWWGIAAASAAFLGFRWYLFVGAVLNTMLFFFVSIPLADGRQSRKPGFAEYKKQTRMLLPIAVKSQNRGSNVGLVQIEKV